MGEPESNLLKPIHWLVRGCWLVRRGAGDFVDLIVGDHHAVVAVAGLDGACADGC